MKYTITLFLLVILCSANAQTAFEKGIEIDCDTAETVFEQLICAQWIADSLHTRVLTLTKTINETSDINIEKGHNAYLEQIGELYGPPENRKQLENARKRITISEKRIVELEIINSW